MLVVIVIEGIGHELISRNGECLKLWDCIDDGHRSFGLPQPWSIEQRGIGGELLIADILAKLVSATPGGSVLFLGLDLGAPGVTHPLVPKDPRWSVVGFGGDVDVALFLREHKVESARYGTSRRGLDQDHLVLIDSKQYSEDWHRSNQFARAEERLNWLRHTLSHPRLLGSGSDSISLRMSYHFVHTGKWLPRSWLRLVGGERDEEVSPHFQWWNSRQDLVFESPIEVLLGQLAVLLTFANPEYRAWVPEALWSLLAPSCQQPYHPN